MDKEHKIILMLLEENEVKHYCLVKNEQRLLSSQVTKSNRKHHFLYLPSFLGEALSKSSTVLFLYSAWRTPSA